MLRSDLCDYSDAYAYIAVKWRISITGTNNINRINKKIVFKIMLRLDHAYQK